MDQINPEVIKPYIVLLVPLLWGVLEAIKRAGVPKKWIPFVNAALSLLAGGGLALFERQDLIPAVSQVVILFLGAAGVHDRLEKLIKKPEVKPDPDVDYGPPGMVYPGDSDVWTSDGGTYTIRGGEANSIQNDPEHYTQGSE